MIDNESVYIGIDPGASGGMAVLDWTGAATKNFSGTDKETWEWLSAYKRFTEGVWNREIFAVIEKVGGHVGTAQPGSAMFKFGRSYGFLIGCLVAAGIPFEEAPPQKWQKALGIPRRGKDESKTAWKNRLKQHAERLFPNIKVTLAVADALLIAEYCRRIRTSQLKEALS